MRADDGEDDDGSALVRRIAEATGADPGRRLLHARGTWVRGRFEPLPQAGELCAASVFDGSPTPVTRRFSSTLGGPDGHDGDPGDQGFAVRIGGLDLVMFTLPVFFARTGADMVEFLRASAAADPDRLAEFLHRHPEAAAAVWLAETAGAIESFTGVSYHGVHAFGMVGRSGTQRWVRLHWRPLHALPAQDRVVAQARRPDYLSAELPARLPARFVLTAQLPDGGDPHDPTRLWADTEELPLGILTVDAVETPSEEPDFDPLRLPRDLLAPRDRLVSDRSRVYRAARYARAATVG